MKTSIRNGFVAAALGALAVLPGANQAKSEDPASLSLKPMKGVSLDIGKKHAVGYFLTKDGACELTLVLATATDGEISQDSPGTRLNVRVDAGKSAKIDAAAGKTAEFTCAKNGKAMSARVFDLAAWTPSQS